MGAYVTNADVVDRVGTVKAAQLTTDSGSTPDTDTIDAIIAEIEGEVLSDLRKRTTATITEADHPQSFALLRGLVLARVIKELYGLRPPIPEDVKGASQRAIEHLKELGEHKRDLPDLTLGTGESAWGSSDPVTSRANDGVGVNDD